MKKITKNTMKNKMMLSILMIISAPQLSKACDPNANCLKQICVPFLGCVSADEPSCAFARKACQIECGNKINPDAEVHIGNARVRIGNIDGSIGQADRDIAANMTALSTKINEVEAEKTLLKEITDSKKLYLHDFTMQRGLLIFLADYEGQNKTSAQKKTETDLIKVIPNKDRKIILAFIDSADIEGVTIAQLINAYDLQSYQVFEEILTAALDMAIATQTTVVSNVTVEKDSLGVTQTNLSARKQALIGERLNEEAVIREQVARKCTPW